MYMYRKSEKVKSDKEGNETTCWTEAFTLHDHDCGHVYPIKI